MKETYSRIGLPPRSNWLKVMLLYLVEFGFFLLGLYAIYWFLLRTSFTGSLYENDFKVEFDSGYGHKIEDIS